MISGKSAILDRFQKEHACCILIKIREDQPGDDGKEQNASSQLPRALNSIALALGVHTFLFPSAFQKLGMLRAAFCFVLLYSCSPRLIRTESFVVSILNAVQATIKPESQQNFDRLWNAFDNGLELYKAWFPNRPVFVILDEVTFLLPRPDDSKQLLQSKTNCLDTICSLSIRHSLDQRDARFVITSSSPYFFRHFPIGSSTDRLC